MIMIIIVMIILLISLIIMRHSYLMMIMKISSTIMLIILRFVIKILRKNKIKNQQINKDDKLVSNKRSVQQTLFKKSFI